MIKRIIFDLDYTIFNWIDPFSDSLKEFFDRYNIVMDAHTESILIGAVAKYEMATTSYNEEVLSKYVCREFNVEYTPYFCEILKKNRLQTEVELMANAKEILEYLNSKYEVVILSNWMGIYQDMILDKLEINHYFKEKYYPETFKKKPYFESYDKARGNHAFKECIMIGDGVKNDYLGPKENGMQAILFDKNNKYAHTNYKRITNLIELKEIL